MDEIISPQKESLKTILRENFFEGEKISVKIFEIIIIILTFLSIGAIILETIEPINSNYGILLLNLEWFFTIFFTIEFILRIYSAQKKSEYIFSFHGLIDFISVLPLYISLIFTGSDKFEILRIFRILRGVSRIIKITQNIDSTAASIKTFKHFLGKDEVMQIYLKTSRKRYFVNYILIIIFSIFSFIGIMENFYSEITLVTIPVVKLISYVLLIVSIIYLIKYEIIITNKRYAITNHRILSSIGIIEEHFNSTSYKYITDITLTQSFTDKLLGLGTIEIKTTGSEYGNVKLEHISKPIHIKKILHDNINYN